MIPVPRFRSRSRRRWTRVAAVGVALAAVIVGCSESAPPERVCRLATDCDDGNACTADVCTSRGLCSNAPDDDVVLEQKPGDCLHQECHSGVVTPVRDGSDFVDDLDPCTADACDGTTPTHLPLPEGAACTVGPNGGTCVAGACVVTCDADDPPDVCDDANPCTDDTCNFAFGQCRHDAIDGVDRPEEEQVTGDCRRRVCAAGVVTDAVDDVDLPDDGNPCTNDVCSNGAPSNPNQPVDFACSLAGDIWAKVCNGSGKCVQCNVVAQCVHVPLDDECQKRFCIAGACTQTFTAADTPLSAGQQTANDCKLKVCNGSGGTKFNADDADQCLANACGVATCTCNGQGSCKRKAGSICAANGDCASNMCNTMAMPAVCL